MSFEQAIGPRIKRISNAMDRKRTRDLEDLELTSSQGIVLGYLVRNRDSSISPGDIGKHFGLSHPTVTGILQRLETKAYIRYAEDPADRRRKRIEVTERALDCHCRIQERFLETENRLTAGMSEEARAGLLALLDQMIANMGAGDDASKNKEEPK